MLWVKWNHQLWPFILCNWGQHQQWKRVQKNTVYFWLLWLILWKRCSSVRMCPTVWYLFNLDNAAQCIIGCTIVWGDRESIGWGHCVSLLTSDLCWSVRCNVFFSLMPGQAYCMYELKCEKKQLLTPHFRAEHFSMLSRIDSQGCCNEIIKWIKSWIWVKWGKNTKMLDVWWMTCYIYGFFKVLPSVSEWLTKHAGIALRKPRRANYCHYWGRSVKIQNCPPKRRNDYWGSFTKPIQKYLYSI